jgi:hypothetical protein
VTIQYGNGLVRDAEILSLHSNRMCLAMKDASDAEHLDLVENRWVSEAGDAVTFGFSSGSHSPVLPD